MLGRIGRRLYCAGETRMIISATGQDRYGIVRDLAKHVHVQGGSISDSRMCVLGSKFATLVLATFPDERAKKEVQDQLNRAFVNFSIVVSETGPVASFDAPMTHMEMTASGPNQDNILHEFTNLLSTHNISVQDMSTSIAPVPFAGYDSFNIRARIAVPSSIKVETLDAYVDELEEKFGYLVTVRKMD